MITAILRAHLLSLRIRTAAGAGGAVFSAVAGLVFYGFWAFISWIVFLFFAEPRNAAYFVAALSSGLLFVMLYCQLAPILSASFGASLDLRKLLIYPIPRGRLFTVEVLLRITTCGEMLLVLASVATGLIRNPIYGARGAPFVVVAVSIFAATNILLAAGTRHLLERLLLRSHVRELLVLFFVLAGLAPQLIAFTNARSALLLRFLPSQVFWPWGAAARLMLHESPAVTLGLVLIYLMAAVWFGRTQFERGIAYDAAEQNSPLSIDSGSDTRTRDIVEFLYRLPGRLLRDPLAALIEKELRTLLRIPRFRLVYVMSCFLGIVLYLPGMRFERTQSLFVQNGMPVMQLYGVLMLGQISYWNSFGFDRSAAQGYFSWPIRFRDALIAKNAAVALLVLPQTLAVAVVARLAHIPASPKKIVETLAVALVASLYWFAVGNICSVRVPRAMDPNKMNQMSNKMQAFTIWSAPFLLLPVGLAYWARLVFASELVFAGVLLIAAVLGSIFYVIGLDSAVNSACRNRESMLMQLSRSEGPFLTR